MSLDRTISKLSRINVPQFFVAQTNKIDNALLKWHDILIISHFCISKMTLSVTCFVFGAIIRMPTDETTTFSFGSNLYEPMWMDFAENDVWILSAGSVTFFRIKSAKNF